MKKSDRLFREVLNRIYRKGERFFKQRQLAEACDISIGLVNSLVAKLSGFGALEKKPQGFRVVDVDRVLTYWSVTRDLSKDICYTTYVPSRVNKIESDLPKNAIFTAYSGYTKYFGDAPFHYDKVYTYANPKSIRKRYKLREDKDPNLLVLKSDSHLKKLSLENVVSLPQLYVDLWQIGKPADRFVKKLKGKMKSRALRGLKKVEESRNEE